ncbi:MAG: flavodoxin domain-containing protein [Candidatus Hodarchaeota archaeon]
MIKTSDKKVLIAYGSRYGSTAEISQEISKIFKESDIKTLVLDLKKTKEKLWPMIDEFDAILVGSGIKIGRWMKEPQKFLKKNKDKIKTKRKILGLFVSCSTVLDDPVKAKKEYLEKIIDDLDIKADLFDAFGPLFDFSETSNLGSLTKKILKSILSKSENIEFDPNTRNDLRDWSQIRSFVEKLVELMK